MRFAVNCIGAQRLHLIRYRLNLHYQSGAKTKKYTVTLKTIVRFSEDAKVYLKSDKKFSGKTNSKGQVTFKITNLNKMAKYKAKISYAGDITYEAATKTVTLTVK